MNRITATLILGLGAAGLGFLTWLAIAQERSGKEPETRFERASHFAFSDVEKCLKRGNGSRVFSHFEEIYIRHGNTNCSYSIYLDPNGSRLSVRLIGDKKAVRFKSAQMVSADELDLLEWCVDQPKTTWIPRRFR